MRVIAITLVLLALAAPAEATDPTGRVFVELSTPRTTVRLGEVFTVRLVVGYDRAFFDGHVVAVFRRTMDVPLQVLAPDLDDPVGATRLTPAVPNARTDGIELLTFALGDRVVDVRRAADRGEFATLELIRRYRAARPGPLRFAAPVVRFTYADEVVEDLFGARRAEDQRTAEISGAPLEMTIAELPAEGRPVSFSGAIGSVTVTATANRTEVEVHDTFELTLRLESQGEVSAYAPPRLDDLNGFHVLGRLDDARSPIRTVTYEIAPLDASITEIPPIAFATFDPESGTYRESRTSPIPLRVRATTGGSPTTSTSPDDPEPGESSAWLRVGAIIGAIVAVVVVVLLRRRRAPAAVDPKHQRIDDALAALTTRLDAGDATDLETPFAEYLAARLDCSAAAVVSPDLVDRLANAGVSTDAATRAAALLEHLVGARYGGTIDPDVHGRVRGVITEIQEPPRA